MIGSEDMCLGKNSLLFAGSTGGLDVCFNQGSQAAGIWPYINHTICNCIYLSGNYRWDIIPITWEIGNARLIFFSQNV
jgi:hypothetical protein